MRVSLVALLLAEPDAAKAAAECIGEAEAWDECADLALVWGALPRLCERLAAFGYPIPPKMNSLLLDGGARTVMQARGSLAALRRFAQAGLRTVAFKGLASLAVLYGDPRRRVMADADILIAEADLEQACTLLGEIGFSAGLHGSLAEYRAFLRNAPGFGGNEELEFQDGRSTSIDLHWRLGAGFDPAALITRARPAVLLGTEFLAVAPADGLLLTVHHSLRNHFNPDVILRDLLDIGLWCAALEESGEVREAVKAAGEHGLAVPMRALTGILGGFDPGCSAARVAEETGLHISQRGRKEAAALCALFDTQLREGAMDRDLLYLLRPAEALQIAKGLLFGGRRHLEIARAMDTALAGKPVGARQRVGAILGALRSMRPRHFRMLRSLARAKDTFARSGAKVS
ncbi:MAG: nucleotidyltransferase family protein [Vicinamibacterales bacterium]